MDHTREVEQSLHSSSVDRRAVSASENTSDLARPGGRVRDLWTVGRAFVLLAAVMVLFVGGMRPDKDLVSSAFVVALCLGLLLLLDRSRYYLAWSSLVIGLVIFAHVRVFADETAIPIRYIYVIDLERLLFAGHVPTVWLQQRLYEFGNPSALDFYLMVIYLSYFFVPYGAAAALWTWRRRDFAKYVVGILGTFYLGLLIYFLVPTSPPWLSAEEGHLPHVFRIVRDILYGTNPFIYREGVEVVGKNDVAAMPSLHFGVTLLVLLALWRYGRVVKALGLAYTISMGVALVYLGEHYVIDVIAGAAVAAVIWWAVERWMPSEPSPDSPEAMAASPTDD